MVMVWRLPHLIAVRSNSKYFLGPQTLSWGFVSPWEAKKEFLMLWHLMVLSLSDSVVLNIIFLPSSPLRQRRKSSPVALVKSWWNRFLCFPRSQVVDSQKSAGSPSLLATCHPCRIGWFPLVCPCMPVPSLRQALAPWAKCLLCPTLAFRRLASQRRDT